MRSRVAVAAAVALIAVHGVVLRYAWSHLRLSATLAAGLAAILLLKHAGLLGGMFAALRKRFRSGGRGGSGDG